MVQVILKTAYGAGWTAASKYFCINGGEGAVAYSATFGINAVNIVMPLDGSFKNLTVYSPGAHPSYTATLMVNNSPTTLSAGIASGDTQSSNTSSIVSVSEGDSVCMRLTVNPPGSGSGYPVSVSIEFEGDNQFYSINPFTGSVSGTNPGISARRGGALGNGDWSVQPWPISPTLANFYSIAAATGNITKLVMKAYGGAPGAGTWTGYIIKNQILQDGTGGTVDTEVIMTGTDVYSTSSFTLPVTLGDHVEIVVNRTGINAPFALAQIAASIVFDPTDSESFMNVGGSNDVVSNTQDNWLWVRSQQLNLDEAENSVPISLRGIHVTGLYVELTSNTQVGTSRVFTLRKNGADTAVSFTISYPALNGQILGQDVDYEFGDLMVLQVDPVSSPGASDKVYWGLISLVEEEESEGGIYQMVPGKTDDTIYSGDDTVDVKIPDPYFKTGVLGE